MREFCGKHFRFIFYQSLEAFFNAVVSCILVVSSFKLIFINVKNEKASDPYKEKSNK